MRSSLLADESCVPAAQTVVTSPRALSSFVLSFDLRLGQIFVFPFFSLAAVIFVDLFSIGLHALVGVNAVAMMLETPHGDLFRPDRFP